MIEGMRRVPFPVTLFNPATACQKVSEFWEGMNCSDFLRSRLLRWRPLA
jgi:hypothetical protein